MDPTRHKGEVGICKVASTHRVVETDMCMVEAKCCKEVPRNGKFAKAGTQKMFHYELYR